MIIAADEAGIEAAQSLTYPTVLCTFYRVAASPEWTCSFTILFDKTVADRSQMRE